MYIYIYVYITNMTSSPKRSTRYKFLPETSKLP